MIFLLALIPATALTVAGYFVLYLSARSEGSLRTFGRYLGFWAFTLAGLVVLGAMFAAGHMRREHPGMWGMHDEMHRRWMEERREFARPESPGHGPEGPASTTPPPPPPGGAPPPPAGH
ncbi:MAG TPA: hypothetical protein VNX02_08110 [Steroidobacteraceae bacterium]|jgi:hypothetical protein|nr:hypothetical protein [Steroidobacteraceae bacterium]